MITIKPLKNNCILFTGLTNTLVKPLTNDVIEYACVRVNDHSKEGLYMQKTALSTLIELEKAIPIVPCTSWHKEDIDTLLCLKNQPFMILENGATIIFENEPLKTWSEAIDEITKEIDFKELTNSINQQFSEKIDPTFGIQCIDNRYLKIKMMKDFQFELDVQLLFGGFYTTKDQSFLYVMPNGINKFNAMRVLLERLNEQSPQPLEVYGAGSSEDDIAWLSNCHHIYAPIGSDAGNKYNQYLGNLTTNYQYSPDVNGIGKYLKNIQHQLEDKGFI